MHACDEICRRILTDCKARAVFLVDYCGRELVTLGDTTLESAERLVASMPSESDEDAPIRVHIDAPKSAIRERFATGGYVLVLFDGEGADGLVKVAVRITMVARSLANFAAPPERAAGGGDSSSGAPSRVAAWRR